VRRPAQHELAALRFEALLRLHQQAESGGVNELQSRDVNNHRIGPLLRQVDEHRPQRGCRSEFEFPTDCDDCGVAVTFDIDRDGGCFFSSHGPEDSVQAVTLDSFGSRARLTVGGSAYDIHRLDAVIDDPRRLPYSLRILLENVLRQEDGANTTADDITALADRSRAATEAGSRELQFMPARVLMQDFTGVPAIVDLAAMRDAMVGLGGDPSAVEPRIPVDLVIDHSIVADVAGVPDAFVRNAQLEFERNRERYTFLRWAQGAFRTLRVFPPNRGICHQVNLEYLAPVVFRDEHGAAYPDTLVGTDSHTPMVNGLGVLGWGVGGIEAEAAMLGQPLSMLLPKVVGIELVGALPPGSTATDLVLTVAEMLRQHGVVGKFVEFYGDGVARVPLENRATIGNMSPEYGSTCTIFPIDDETLRYLRATGRPDDVLALVEAYAKEQGLWHDPDARPVYDETLVLDLSAVEPSLAGPARPQDRVPLSGAKVGFEQALLAFRRETDDAPIGVSRTSNDEASLESFPASDPPAPAADADANELPPVGSNQRPIVVDRKHCPVTLADGREFELFDGHVVIAAITSCTNTSNPSVMIAAGLLARNAVARGLSVPPWVKTSLAPGSLVVTDYYKRAGLLAPLEQLGFSVVGYGCTTCIGNSGPLQPEISDAINSGGLSVASVLSGNRNFEGRIHPDCRMNYLASPPLVVAYALAGSMDVDLVNEPIGAGTDGPVFLRDIWPGEIEVAEVVGRVLDTEMFRRNYATILDGDEHWRALDAPTGDRYAWDETSTYIRRPPFLEGITADAAPVRDVAGARALALLGDSVTTDHISPAGVIRRDSPAGRWLEEQGVAFRDFNSYGSRRGNHEVMMRGTFANVRLRNRLAPGTEGGFTLHLPDGTETTIYDGAMQYASEGIPLVVVAGREYGSGSSRDWAAKGSQLLGIRAVLAESFERIHRSNLVGMGVIPLEFVDGANASSLGLTGHEVYAVDGLQTLSDGGALPLAVTVRADDKQFVMRARIDTPFEREVFLAGGILPFTLRRLAGPEVR
jgi:aconitate hydratase